MILKYFHPEDSFSLSPRSAPLAAAIIAPLSTLLDIPALTERWFFRYGQPLRDPTANLTLSAIGLLFNFIANLLLMVRFTESEEWWRRATHFSMICWLFKVSEHRLVRLH